MGVVLVRACAFAYGLTLIACSGSDELAELKFPEEPTGINSVFGGATLFGTGATDVWAPVPGKNADGTFNPQQNHVLHHDGRQAKSVAFPAQILALPGSMPTAYAAGRPGELWMGALAGPPGQQTVVLVSMTVDGAAVDHGAQLPAPASTVNGLSLLSDDGAVVVFYGQTAVRIDAAGVEVLPDSPAGAQPVALHGREVYAVANPGNALPHMMRFDGTAWANVPEFGDVTGLSFSFASASDGWAFGGNQPIADEYPLFHFDGSWSALTVTVRTSFEFPGKSTWRPLRVLATGTGTYAMLGQVMDGQQGTTAAENSVVYRTGDAGELSSDDHTLTPVEDECHGACASQLSFVSELDDGTFLMATARGGNEMPTRIFYGDRSELK